MKNYSGLKIMKNRKKESAKEFIPSIRLIVEPNENGYIDINNLKKGLRELYA